LDRFVETSAAGGDKPGAAGEAPVPPAPAVRSPSPGLQRLARPVEIEANARLRPGAEAHRAQLGGVRVHVVERYAEVERELPRIDQREASRRRADDLSQPRRRRLGDRLDVAVGEDALHDRCLN
jgi:hypothetical protein